MISELNYVKVSLKVIQLKACFNFPYYLLESALLYLREFFAGLDLSFNN